VGETLGSFSCVFKPKKGRKVKEKSGKRKKAIGKRGERLES